MDHGFGAGRKGFVVAGETAVLHEPAEASFHDPASGLDDGPRVFRTDVVRLKATLRAA